MAEEVEQVIVDIDEAGNVKVDVKKSAGAKCKKLTEAFRGMGKVTDEQLKPEFYAPGQTNNITTSVRR